MILTIPSACYHGEQLTSISQILGDLMVARHALPKEIEDILVQFSTNRNPSINFSGLAGTDPILEKQQEQQEPKLATDDMPTMSVHQWQEKKQQQDTAQYISAKLN